MATEQFLINPPKRKPSRKHFSHKRKSMAGMKKHRILAFESKAGGLFTSPTAKIVRKGIKINPFRFRSNPLGEELMFVGLNPRKGGKAMATHKKHHKRHRKNPVRKHRRYHRNPMSTKALIPMVVSGTAGALVGRTVPQFIPFLKDMGTAGNIISKVLLAFAGSMLIDKSGLGRKMPSLFSADGWMAGSAIAGVTDLSSIGIVKTMQGLGMIGDGSMIAPYRPMGEFVTMEGAGESPFADTEAVYGS